MRISSRLAAIFSRTRIFRKGCGITSHSILTIAPRFTMVGRRDTPIIPPTKRLGTTELPVQQPRLSRSKTSRGTGDTLRASAAPTLSTKGLVNDLRPSHVQHQAEPARKVPRDL